jgi:hypothetical protein
MVGKRDINGTSQEAVKESTNIRKDVEEGRLQQDRKYRFRDQGNLDPDDQRRVEFKKKSLVVVDENNLKRYKKSIDEVCSLSLSDLNLDICIGEGDGGC